MHREEGFDHVSLRTVVSLRSFVAPAARADAQKEHRTKAQALTRPPRRRVVDSATGCLCRHTAWPPRKPSLAYRQQAARAL